MEVDCPFHGRVKSGEDYCILCDVEFKEMNSIPEKITDQMLQRIDPQNKKNPRPIGKTQMNRWKKK